jgi:hypothetical protein
MLSREAVGAAYRMDCDRSLDLAHSLLEVGMTDRSVLPALRGRIFEFFENRRTKSLWLLPGRAKRQRVKTLTDLRCNRGQMSGYVGSTCTS